MNIAASVFAPFLAFAPIAWLILGLAVFRIQARNACALGLLLAAVLAVFGWGMPFSLLCKAVLDGAAFALLPIVWVILAAFFTYNLARETKALDAIRELLAYASPDRRIQGLLIAWGLGSFMEGVAGFGTAVAVPAALLIALGFEPFLAAVVCLLANTVAVAFGVLGVPVITLAQVTGLPLPELSEAIIVQLTPFVFCVPACIVLAITGSVRGLYGVWLPTLASGAGFSAGQYLTVRYIGPELPAVIGSLAALAATLAIVKLLPPKEIWRLPGDSARENTRDGTPVPGFRKQLTAWSPYILLLALVLLTSRLFPEINTMLAKAKTSVSIYDGPGGKPFSIAWLLTPGSLVMAAAILGGFAQGASLRQLRRVFGNTVLQLRGTAMTIVCIVSMAKVLGYSGMVTAIAEALAGAAGGLYPLVAPLLGMLGTFITGSDTSSNILFGQLQKEVALSIGASPVWLAAANTTGACIGKLISPQSMAVAAISTGLTGREGDLLRPAMRYAAVFIAALCVLTYSVAR